jgi:hypothetical protein
VGTATTLRASLALSPPAKLCTGTRPWPTGRDIHGWIEAQGAILHSPQPGKVELLPVDCLSHTFPRCQPVLPIIT